MQRRGSLLYSMIDLRAFGFADTVTQTRLSCSQSRNVVNRPRGNRIMVRHLADRYNRATCYTF